MISKKTYPSLLFGAALISIILSAMFLTMTVMAADEQAIIISKIGLIQDYEEHVSQSLAQTYAFYGTQSYAHEEQANKANHFILANAEKISAINLGENAAMHLTQEKNVGKLIASLSEELMLRVNQNVTDETKENLYSQINAREKEFSNTKKELQIIINAKTSGGLLENSMNSLMIYAIVSLILLAGSFFLFIKTNDAVQSKSFDEDMKVQEAVNESLIKNIVDMEKKLNAFQNEERITDAFLEKEKKSFKVIGMADLKELARKPAKKEKKKPKQNLKKTNALKNKILKETNKKNKKAKKYFPKQKKKKLLNAPHKK